VFFEVNSMGVGPVISIKTSSRALLQLAIEANGGDSGWSGLCTKGEPNTRSRKRKEGVDPSIESEKKRFAISAGWGGEARDQGVHKGWWKV